MAETLREHSDQRKVPTNVNTATNRIYCSLLQTIFFFFLIVILRKEKKIGTSSVLDFGYKDTWAQKCGILSHGVLMSHSQLVGLRWPDVMLIIHTANFCESWRLIPTNPKVSWAVFLTLYDCHAAEVASLFLCPKISKSLAKGPRNLIPCGNSVSSLSQIELRVVGQVRRSK